MVFNAISGILQQDGAPIHFHLEFFLPVLHTVFSPSHWLLSHITMFETMDNGEKGMNPITVTIISPWKEYCLSPGLNQRLPLLKPCTLPSWLWGSSGKTYWARKEIVVTIIPSIYRCFCYGFVPFCCLIENKSTMFVRLISGLIDDKYFKRVHFHASDNTCYITTQNLGCGDK